MKLGAPLASKQLHALCALDRHRSYTRAAEDLGVTQSAVTHAIQALETRLGAKLVHLMGKRVRINELGLTIVDRARKVLQEMDEICAEVERARHGPRRAARVKMFNSRKVA